MGRERGGHGRGWLAVDTFTSSERVWRDGGIRGRRDAGKEIKSDGRKEGKR